MASSCAAVAPSVLAAGLILAITAGVSPSISAPTPAADLVTRMREQVLRLQADAPSIVAREQYKQTVSYRRADPFGPQAASRTLISELVMVRLPGTAGWISFRDVFEVDGRRLDDREKRLVELLQNPNPSALQQARQLAEESARYNIGSLPRTINVPDIAFEYLSARHAERISFSAPGRARINGVDTMVMRFSEHTGPTILRNSEGRDLQVSGRVWVEPDSGALVRTEVIVRDRNSAGTCTVDFAVDQRLGARVPLKMTERYDLPRSASTIDSVAQYSDFRRFGVATDEKIVKPPPFRH